MSSLRSLALLTGLIAPLCASAGELGPIAQSAAEVRPAAVGTAAPDASVRTIEGTEIRLSSMFGDQPVALIFYRGGW